MYLRIPTLYCVASILTLASVGCSVSPTAAPTAEPGIALRGNVYGGQQPITNAHVYLLAANTTGYGQPSLSLLSQSATGNADVLGAYVLTDYSGNFSIAGDYSCTPNTQVYLYVSGGNAGAGPNPSSSLMSILGNCPLDGNFSSVPFVAANEVTTVAAAYALAGFATDATHVSSSGTPLAQTGIANAFAGAANLVSMATGTALSTTPGGNGTAPAATINSLANVLAACVNSTGANSPGCSTLFSNALSGGTTGTAPSDTATAAINIAHNPAANVAKILNAAGATPPFSPALTTTPNDLTLAIQYTGGGISNPSSIAVDGLGDVWTTNLGIYSVSQLTNTGVPVSPASGYTDQAAYPLSVAIDLQGNAWVANGETSAISEYSPAGVAISPGPSGYVGGGIAVPQAIAIDGLGNAWVANYGNSVSELSSSGTALSPALGDQGGGLNEPGAIAADSSGAVWLANTNVQGLNDISKFASTGAPISSVNGFLGGGGSRPLAIAVDGGGNAWSANFAGNSLTELSTSGSPISPSDGFTGGGLNAPLSIAVDGAGDIWAANLHGSDVSEFANSGTALSPATGLGVGAIFRPEGIAVDGSGNVWVANGSVASVTELVGAATPAVTPLSYAVKNHLLGARP